MLPEGEKPKYALRPQQESYMVPEVTKAHTNVYKIVKDPQTCLDP